MFFAGPLASILISDLLKTLFGDVWRIPALQNAPRGLVGWGEKLVQPVGTHLFLMGYNGCKGACGGFLKWRYPLNHPFL